MINLPRWCRRSKPVEGTNYIDGCLTWWNYLHFTLSILTVFNSTFEYVCSDCLINTYPIPLLFFYLFASNIWRCQFYLVCLYTFIKSFFTFLNCLTKCVTQVKRGPNYLSSLGVVNFFRCEFEDDFRHTQIGPNELVKLRMIDLYQSGPSHHQDHQYQRL